eukprot:TRINITY_DN19689_c0_g1_i1.p1 TRINITY_DN19689_c0_g1~~TRINITY_DN19689_c0_g1_i1.p1  ORF type:complete len:469 (+),score=119.77 TRINITY_DN19689_c0_g1_i1:118-1524(+)
MCIRDRYQRRVRGVRRRKMACGDLNDEETVSTELQAIGTTMVITASFISTFGVNLQKWAHNKNKEIPLAERKPMIQNWRWWIGMGSMITGSLFDLAALPFVPQSRVAALGAVGIVANVIITPLFLGEKLTRHDLVGCAVVCVGCTLACIFGAGTEPEIDSTCLLDYFTAGLFIVYGVMLLVALGVLYYLIHGFFKVSNQVVEGKHCPDDMFDCVWAHHNQQICREYADSPALWPFVYITRFGAQFYPFLVAAFGGMCGANSIMFAKAVLIFLKNSFSDALSLGYLALSLIPFGTCLFLQVTFLNKSLQIYPDALFVLPVYQSFWIVFGVAAGLIFYQEYEQLRGVDVFLFTLGVVLSLIGVQVLTMRKSKRPPSEQASGNDALDEYAEFNDLPIPEFMPHRTLTRYIDTKTSLDDSVVSGSEYRPPVSFEMDWRENNPPLSASCSAVIGGHSNFGDEGPSDAKMRVHI